MNKISLSGIAYVAMNIDPHKWIFKEGKIARDIQCGYIDLYVRQDPLKIWLAFSKKRHEQYQEWLSNGRKSEWSFTL